MEGARNPMQLQQQQQGQEPAQDQPSDAGGESEALLSELVTQTLRHRGHAIKASDAQAVVRALRQFI